MNPKAAPVRRLLPTYSLRHLLLVMAGACAISWLARSRQVLDLVGQVWWPNLECLGLPLFVAAVVILLSKNRSLAAWLQGICISVGYVLTPDITGGPGPSSIREMFWYGVLESVGDLSGSLIAIWLYLAAEYEYRGRRPRKGRGNA